MLETDEKIAGADLIAGIFLVIFGFLVIITSLNMKVYKTFLDAPGFFPFILGIIFLILGSIMIVTSLKRRGYEQIKVLVKNFKITNIRQSVQFRRVIILISLMVVYIFGLIGRINFALATFLYLFFTLYYLKSARMIKIIIISFIASWAISAFFTGFFKVPLP